MLIDTECAMIEAAEAESGKYTRFDVALYKIETVFSLAVKIDKAIN